MDLATLLLTQNQGAPQKTLHGPSPSQGVGGSGSTAFDDVLQSLGSPISDIEGATVIQSNDGVPSGIEDVALLFGQNLPSLNGRAISADGISGQESLNAAIEAFLQDHPGRAGDVAALAEANDIDISGVDIGAILPESDDILAANVAPAHASVSSRLGILDSVFIAGSNTQASQQAPTNTPLTTTQGDLSLITQALSSSERAIYAPAPLASSSVAITQGAAAAQPAAASDLTGFDLLLNQLTAIPSEGGELPDDIRLSLLGNERAGNVGESNLRSNAALGGAGNAQNNANATPAQAQPNVQTTPIINGGIGADTLLNNGLPALDGSSSLHADFADTLSTLLSSGGNSLSAGQSALLAQASSASQSHPATQMVAANLQKAAQGQTNTQLTLQLNPSELGRVEIKLTFDSDNALQAVITAEKPETHTMMQRDSSALTRALEDAGLDINADGGLSFELAQDGSFFDNDNRGGGNDNGGHADGDQASEDDAIALETLETTMTWEVDARTGHTHYSILA